MSKSIRKTPIASFAIASYGGQKKFRQYAHGRERASVRGKIAHEQWEIGRNPAFGNEWDSPRDGKYYNGEGKWAVHKDCDVKYGFCDKCGYDRMMRK